MLRKEWPLITNTILAQLSVGLFLFLAWDRLLLSRESLPEALSLTTPGLAWVGPIMVAAMLLSLFHLGKPFRAYRAMANLPVSWLSWEIFFSSVFLGLWLIFMLLPGSPLLTLLIMGATGLAGLLNVISMSNIYSSTGRPGWKGAGTYLDFLGSTLILGSVGSAFFLSAAGLETAAVKALYLLPLLAAQLVLMAELMVISHFVSTQRIAADEFSLDQLASSSDLNQALLNKYQRISMAGWFLSMLGVLLGITLLNEFLQLTLLLPLLLVLAGELAGRYAFFILVGESEEASRYITVLSYARHRG